MFDDDVKFIIESLVDDLEVFVPLVDVGLAEGIGVFLGEVGDEGVLPLRILGLDIGEVFVQFFSFLWPAVFNAVAVFKVPFNLLVLVDSFPLFLELTGFGLELLKKLFLFVLVLLQLGLCFGVDVLFHVLHLLLLLAGQLPGLVFEDESDVDQQLEQAFAPLLDQPHPVASDAVGLIRADLYFILN